MRTKIVNMYLLHLPAEVKIPCNIALFIYLFLSSSLEFQAITERNFNKIEVIYIYIYANKCQLDLCTNPM